MVGLKGILVGVCLLGLCWGAGAKDRRSLPKGTEGSLAQQYHHAWKQVDKKQHSRAHAAAKVLLVDAPLRIYFEAGPVDPSGKVGSNLMDQAFKQWSRSLGESIAWELASDARQADVIVRVMPEVRIKGKPVAGFTTWSRWSGTTDAGIRAVVTLAQSNGSGDKLSDRAMLQSAMHELGHILGLDDCEGGGVMGPLNPSRPITTPSRSEVQVLTEIRQQSRRLLDAARLWTGPG